MTSKTHRGTKAIRDDFSVETKELLAKRVGMRCSNPNCRQLTSGPQEDPTKALNVGVAAHVAAASKGGPRYDARMTSEQRKAPENGIWLCQNCAKLVDNDAKRYPVDLLQEWKQLSEKAALLEIESPSRADTKNEDVELIRFFAQCFDRPAFQDPFMQEGSMEAFDKAIEDTITAINTGCLRARDGAVLGQARGKAFLTNRHWRDKMDAIVDVLRAIRSRYSLAVRDGQIHVSHHGQQDFYCIHDHAIAEWMDASRAEALRLFAEVCEDAGIQPPTFPRWRGRPLPGW